MITPKALPTLGDRLIDLWRQLTLSPSALEDERVRAIDVQMGGTISLDEIRRIVRTHRIWI
jgi:hypothetical protein